MNKEAEQSYAELKSILKEAKASASLSWSEIFKFIDGYAMQEMEERVISKQSNEELGDFVKHFITKLNYEKQVEYYYSTKKENTSVRDFIHDEIVFMELEEKLKPEGTRMLLIGDYLAAAPIQMMLRVKRAYEGLSDSQVADIIGCSTKDIREFEVGKKCLPEKYHRSLELYLFNKKYYLDEYGDYIHYDEDWNN